MPGRLRAWDLRCVNAYVLRWASFLAWIVCLLACVFVCLVVGWFLCLRASFQVCALPFWHSDAPAFGRSSPGRLSPRTLQTSDAPALGRSGPRTLRSSLLLAFGCASPLLLWQSLPLWRKHRASLCARPPRSSSVLVFGRFGPWPPRVARSSESVFSFFLFVVIID